MMNDDEFRWFMFRNVFYDVFLIKYRKSSDYRIETDDEIEVDDVFSRFKMKCAINGIDEYWVSDESRFQFMSDVFKREDIDEHFYMKSAISNDW